MAGFAVEEAAHRVGVSAWTLRSWERRYGLAPSVRTPGGHRRYSAADIASLQSVRRLIAAGVAPSSAARTVLASAPPPSRRTSSAAAAWAQDAESLHVPRCARAAREVVRVRGAAEAWSVVFAPWLRGIGEHWSRSGDGVEREHVGSDAAQEALAEHARRRARSLPASVLAVPAPGELHVLPLHALAAALADEGVACVVLGALPERAWLAALRDLRPSAVVVWSHHAQTADVALLEALCPHSPAVFAAGPGWTGVDVPAPVARLTEFADAVADVAALARPEAPR